MGFSNCYAITLSQALQLSIKNDPKIQAAVQRYKIAKSNKINAIANFLPDVSASNTYTNQKSKVLQSGALTRTDNASSLSLSAAQPIPLLNLSGMLASLDATKYATKSEYYNFLIICNQEILNAVNAYVNVIQTQHIYALDLNNEKLLKRRLDISKSKLKLGEATETDTVEVEAQLALATSDRIDARTNVINSRIKYKHLIGIWPKAVQTPDAKILIKTLPSSLNKALQIMGQNNPGIQAARFQQKSYNKQIKYAESKLFPSVTLVDQFSYDRKKYDSINQSQNSWNNSFGISVNFSIFKGGTQYNNIKVAKLSANQAMYSYYGVLRDTREAVINLWNNIKAQNSAITAAKKAVHANQIALNMVNEAQKLGSKTTLDVLDQEQKLLQAKLKLINARSQYIVLIYNLLSYLGNLNQYSAL